MKVLITGGGGFIGSHLTEKYLGDGHEVYVLDNFSTGSPKNLEHLSGNSKLHIKRDSILNKEICAELVGTCDMVFHLAAAVGVKYVMEHPLESLEVNTRGTEIILDLCQRLNKRVLVASTSEIYGKNEAIPLKEDADRVLGPTTRNRWGYSCSKALDEFLSFAYHRTRNLSVVIVRLFNTVGPRQTGRYGMVIPRLVQQALNGEHMTVYGDGRQTRAFGFVKDVVKAISLLMETPKAVGDVFNVGGSEEISILELATKIKELTGSTSKIILIPYEEAYERDFEDMRRRVPDCSKLQSMIGFKPQTPLENILKEVIAAQRI